MNLPRCRRCNTRLIQKSMDGKTRLRASVIVFQGDAAAAVCKQCGDEVPIDLHLGAGLRKALAADGPKLVVRKNLDPP